MVILGGSLWLLFFLIFVEIGILILFTVLWFRSMYRAMSACHPVSRSADPDTIWLNFIPVFGLVWQFICVSRVSDTLAREYHRRGWYSDENRPALESGIVTGVVICIAVVVQSLFTIHPGIGFFITLAMCMCMYRHTDRLNSFRERLEKELDPTTAFGQIPVMQQIVTTPSQQQFPLPQTLVNIPFAPQPTFVPQQNNIPHVPQQNSFPPPEKPEDDLTRYMPKIPPQKTPEIKPSNTSDEADRTNRWAPPGKKS
ncbi:MAG: hypothetical protein ABIQ40_05425 [Bacteroidia bacterium]